MNKPLYKHDSECCTYFKTDKDEFGNISDIYICNKNVIYRHSDEPSDNHCFSFDEEVRDLDFLKQIYPRSYELLQEFYELKVV